MTTHAAGRTIEVSKELILRACRKDSSHCMIAEAIKELWPWATHISVDLQTIRVSDPGRRERITYLTPRKAQLAIINFDQGNTVEPFDFQLRRPNISRMEEKKNSAGLPGKKTGKNTSKIITRSRGAYSEIVATIGRSLPAFRVGRRRTFGIKSLEP